MSEGCAATVSDECHRLQTELRQTSQKNLVKGLLEALCSLRFDVWANKSTTLQILAPFKEIIVHPNLTDVITSVAVSSVYSFLVSRLFQTEEDVTTVVQSLCSCQYQVTSDVECLNLSIQILRCFLVVVDFYANLLTTDSMDSLFHYCEQDVRQLSQKCVHTTILTEIFSKLSFLIVDQEKYRPIRSDALSTLFSIADSSYIDNGWVARGASISALLLCAKSDKGGCSRELVKITCVIINQQLAFTDGRENFVMSLRLFFLVFKEKWLELPLLFAKILNSILDCCQAQAIPAVLRCTCFEILVDFISQKSFFLNFYANYANRPLFPQLFDKFMNVLSSFANLPAPVPEAHSSALSLLSLIISQLNDEKCELQQNIEYDLSTQWEEESEQLKKLTTFAAEFNEHPSSVANNNLTSSEIAFNIITAPGVMKSAIGEFFSKNTPIALETMEKYLKYLDFSHLDFDQSIRLFLTSFTILGEGQVIDRNTEAFANAFFAQHSLDGIFKDEKAVHVLAYGWLMIHTSMHNQNVTKKTSLPEFFSMMKGQNGEENFDSQFLTTIYNSVKRSQVEIGDEKSGSIAFWELLMQKQAVLNFQTNRIENPIPAKYIVNLFKEVWKQAASIFSIIYERAAGDTENISNTFIICASISTKYSLHDVLDNLVVSLCRFTNTETKHALTEERAKNALKALSTIVIDYGAQIHEGWKSFAEILIDLFGFDLLPEDMRTDPVLIGKPEKIVISPSMWSQGAKQHSQPSFLSVFKILGAVDKESESEGSAAELRRSELRAFVRLCNFEKIADQSVSFSSQSINFFMQSLILLARDAIANITDRAADAAFCVHLITQISVANCDRISPLWNVISQLFSTIFSEAQVNKPTIIFLQRVVVSIFTLVNHMWGQPKLRPELIKLTDFVTNIDQKIFLSLIPEILSGFQLFLSLHGASYISLHQFKSLNKLLVSSIGITDPPAVQILHTFLQGIAEDKEPPSLDRFAEYWMPLVQTTVVFCIRDPSPDAFTRFGDLHTLLAFGGGIPKPSMWEFVFDSTLFPAMEHIPNEIANSKKSPNIGERCLLMTKTVFKIFLQVQKEMISLPNFEQIWFRLMQYSLNIMKVADQNLKVSIPQMLVNALMVMKSAGVFNDETKQKMWVDSRAVIEPLIPYFSQICENL